MTDGDEKYKLGELTADMAAVKRDIVDIKAGQKEILHRLDNLSVVSLERWEKRNAKVDAHFDANETRLEALEDFVDRESDSILTKVRSFVSSTVVKIVGGIVIVLLGLAIMYYVQKTGEYGEMIRNIQVGQGKQ